MLDNALDYETDSGTYRSSRISSSEYTYYSGTTGYDSGSIYTGYSDSMYSDTDSVYR